MVSNEQSRFSIILTYDRSDRLVLLSNKRPGVKIRGCCDDDSLIGKGRACFFRGVENQAVDGDEFEEIPEGVVYKVYLIIFSFTNYSYQINYTKFGITAPQKRDEALKSIPKWHFMARLQHMESSVHLLSLWPEQSNQLEPGGATGRSARFHVVKQNGKPAIYTNIFSDPP